MEIEYICNPVFVCIALQNINNKIYNEKTNLFTGIIYCDDYIIV